MERRVTAIISCALLVLGAVAEAQQLPAERGVPPSSNAAETFDRGRKWVVVSGIDAFFHELGAQQTPLRTIGEDVLGPFASARVNVEPRPLDYAGSRAGQERSDNGLQLPLCWCPPGSFLMGSPPDEPGREKDEDQKRVSLSRGFWLGKFEVTQEQYRRVMDKSPSYFSATGGGKEKVAGMNTSRFPVEMVSPDEAMECCRQLTVQERRAGRLPAGWEYRLPTEAQWEYACRAGTTTATAFGNSLSSRQANFGGNFPYNGAEKGPYLERPTEVGRYAANAWGLYDMHGNVWEWCLDGYQESLPGGADTFVAPAADSDRVLRGGGWLGTGMTCRSAFRFGAAPESRDDDQGFRVAAVQSE